MSLEDLARSSAESARVSVADIRSEPPQPDRPRWLVPVFAAVLVVVAFGVTFTVVGDGDDTAVGETTTVAGPVEVPRLGLPLLESDLAGAFELPLDDELLSAGGRQFEIVYYGNAGADDPYANGDLAVLSISGPDAPLLTGDDPEVSVRGTQGVIQPTGSPFFGAASAAILWVEAGQDPTSRFASFGLASRSATVEELVALANEGDVVVDDVSGDLRFVPPGRLDLDALTVRNELPLAIGLSGPVSDGYLVAYTAGDDDLTGLSFTTHADDLLGAVTALRWLTPDSHEVDIGGRVGWSGSIADPIAKIVVWSPVPGAVSTLLSFDPTMTETELLDLARSAVPLSDEEWAAAVAKTDEPVELEVFDDYEDVWGEGGGEIDGVAFEWIIGRQANGNICAETRGREGSTGSCSDSVVDGVDAAQIFLASFGGRITSAILVADPIVDDITASTGEALHRVDSPVGTWWVWFGRPNLDPEFEVMVDGEVVQTLSAEFN